MKVKVINSTQPQSWYAQFVGNVFDVIDRGNHYILFQDDGKIEQRVIYPQDCTIIDEPGNRVPFDWDQWKEKGGKVWYKQKEVTNIHRMEGVTQGTDLVGILDGVATFFHPLELTMSAPDEVYYANVYPNSTSCSYQTIEGAKDGHASPALHILEINITKGTNKIVHKYNEKV